MLLVTRPTHTRTHSGMDSAKRDTAEQVDSMRRRGRKFCLLGSFVSKMHRP